MENPDFVKNTMDKLTVEELQKIQETGLNGGDVDDNISKLADLFIPQIHELEMQINTLGNIKDCLTKGFVLQYCQEFFGQKTGQYEHAKFYKAIADAIDRKKQQAMEARAQASMEKMLADREAELRRTLEQDISEKMRQEYNCARQALTAGADAEMPPAP